MLPRSLPPSDFRATEAQKLWTKLGLFSLPCSSYIWQVSNSYKIYTCFPWSSSSFNSSNHSVSSNNVTATTRPLLSVLLEAPCHTNCYPSNLFTLAQILSCHFSKNLNPPTAHLLNDVHPQSFQLRSTFCDPLDCSPPGSSVHGILQARILEWVAISSSRGPSWPRGRTHISCTGRGILCHRATWEAPLTDVPTPHGHLNPS